MFKVTKRGLSEGIINVSVKDGRITYNITASPKKENGKYDLVIFKNGRVFSETKNVCSSIKGMNRKIKSTADFYNMGNTVKRLASLNEKNIQKDKQHLTNLKNRDLMIKKDIERKKKSMLKVEPKVKKEMGNDLKGIMLSYSSVK